MTIPSIQRSSRRRFLSLLPVILAIVLVLMEAGCIRSRNQEPESTPTAIASPHPTTARNGTLLELTESVALLREPGNPDSVLGSAVILGSGGLLVTSSEILNLEGDVEVVLPDGSSFQPALVSVNPTVDLALLTVPAQNLIAAEFSSQRPTSGDETFALGYDGTPASLGQMGGEVTGTVEPTEDVDDFRVRGPLFIETDVNLVQGFVGGALVGEPGTASGVLTAHTDENGVRVGRAVSHWFIQAWLERRQAHLDTLYEESANWELMELPGSWTIPQPDGWTLNVAKDEENTYRSELTPADPDVSLQLTVSVEPNEYGTNADEFIQNVFEDRSSARIWSVEEQDGYPLIRAAIHQEGALVDVAYLLDETHLIAVSMTSAYHPEEDPDQVDEIRAIFETVVSRIDQE